MRSSPAEAQRRIQELQAFVKINMVLNQDYGIITGTPKPSLWQPGAQKLCELYGLAHDFLDIETVQVWDQGFFAYRKRCVLTLRRNGVFVGAGIGSCNSREDRYAWRWMDSKKIPSNIEKKGLVSREGKYGTQYRVPNPDIYSLVNTIEKMAAKRALVHAVIGVTRSAAIFTQDVEDLPAEAFGAVDDSRPWETVQDGEIVEPRPQSKAADLSAEWQLRIASAKDVKSLKSMTTDMARLPEAIKKDLRRAYDVRLGELEQPPAQEREAGEEG
jgi:hypothetical protein